MFFNVCNKYRKLKYDLFFKSLSIVYNKFGHEYEKIFKEQESIEILFLVWLII